MNKPEYYTPDPTEFHDGFEYEWTDISKNGINFLKREYSIKNYLEELEGSPKFCIRVKYLDKEDFESCGWKHSKNIKHTELYTGMINNRRDTLNLMFIPKNSRCLIYLVNGYNKSENIFMGEIKNKSRLLQVMQMCHITKQS